MILKPKTILIEKLINTAESDESIGIVGPAVFDLKNKHSIQEMGMSIDRFGYPFALKSSLDRYLCFFCFRLRNDD